MTDNLTKLEIAARNTRIEKEIAAAFSNKSNINNKKNNTKKSPENKVFRSKYANKPTPAKSANAKKTGSSNYVKVSSAVSVSNPGKTTKAAKTNTTSKRGRGPKKPLDFSTLSDVTFVNEVPIYVASPFVATCSICGGTKNVGYFKSANICLKCLNKIKRIM